MSTMIHSRLIIDVALWFCWWPPGKPMTYQAGTHNPQINKNMEYIAEIVTRGNQHTYNAKH